MWLTQQWILPKHPWLCINKVMNAQLWEWCWLCSTWESVEGTNNTVAFWVLRNNGNSIFLSSSQWSNGTVDKLWKTTAKYLKPTRKKSFEQIKLFHSQTGKKRETEGLLLLFLFLNTYEMLKYYFHRGYISSKTKKKERIFSMMFLYLYSGDPNFSL